MGALSRAPIGPSHRPARAQASEKGDRKREGREEGARAHQAEAMAASGKLHLACQMATDLDAVRKLLKTDDPMKKDRSGKTALHAVACADAAPGINRSARFTYKTTNAQSGRAEVRDATFSLYTTPDALLEGVKAAFGIPPAADCRFYTRESVDGAAATLAADPRTVELLKDPNVAAVLKPMLSDAERMVTFLADEATASTEAGKLVSLHAPTRISARALVEGRAKNFWDMYCVAAKALQLPTTRYKIEVFTAKRPGAGTDANVRILLQGKNSGRDLVQSTNIGPGSPFFKPGTQQNFGGWHELTSKSDRSLFDAGACDAFYVTDHNLGELTMCRIGHDGSGFEPEWLLEKLVVTMEDTGRSWTFACGKWFDDKRSMVEQVDSATGATTGKVKDQGLLVGADNGTMLVARDLRAEPNEMPNKGAPKREKQMSMAASSAMAGTQDENTYSGTNVNTFAGLSRPSAYTARADRPGVCKLLLAKSKNKAKLVAAPTSEGLTALMIACRHGQVELASALLEAGAQPGAVDNYGDSALHMAAYAGQFEAARLLLEAAKKAPTKPSLLELPNKMGWNALHWAAHGGRPGVLALLLRTALDTGLRDAVLGQRDAYGRQPVHIAAKGRLPKVLEMLLEYGSDPVSVAEGGPDHSRQIPYHFACLSASGATKALLAGPSAKPAGTALEQLAGRDRWRASTAQWLREN